MATFLVTGAAGFIGSIVCEKLLELGHQVVGVDNLNSYYDVRLKDYRLNRLTGMGLQLSDAGEESVFSRLGEVTNGNFRFLPFDIESLELLDCLFAGTRFDAVINLAARAGVRASMENPYVFLSTNTEGTLNLLECQRKYGVKKHVLASTSSLYAGCVMPFSETLAVNTPLSPYAASKKAAELMAHSYHKLYGIDVTVVRYFTVFGPAGRPDMSIYRFIQWIDSGQDIELFGDGRQSRDFTYVDDIANGTIAATVELGYEIINLGGGRNPITLLDIIEKIENRLGCKAKIVKKPVHKADIDATWADISKAASIIGWAPKIAPLEGLQKTIDWHIENRGWLRGLRM